MLGLLLGKVPSGLTSRYGDPVRMSSNQIWGFPKIRGTLFGGPYNKDYSVLGSILGSPYLGKLPYIIATPYHISP